MSTCMQPFIVHHNCRECGGYLNGEHYAEIDVPHQGCVIIMEYCESCELGWETVANVSVGWRKKDFTVVHDPRLKPIKFGGFLQRLRDAQEVAA